MLGARDRRSSRVTVSDGAFHVLHQHCDTPPAQLFPPTALPLSRPSEPLAEELPTHSVPYIETTAPLPPNMADAAVENPANTVAPHKKQLPSSIPNFDTLEGFSTEGNDDYSNFKKLQRQLE